MKIEDVKPGMWVRCGVLSVGPDTTGAAVTRVTETYGCDTVHCVRMAEVVPHAGADCFFGPRDLEPWTPRVGDWVRPRGHHPAVVVDWLPKVGFKGCVLVEYPDGVGEFTGGRVHVAIDDVEPCAAPEAKPDVYTLKEGVTADMIREHATGGKIEAMGFASPTTPDLERLYREWMDARKSVKAKRAPEEMPTPKPRDHNTTCKRCGGRAYQGIGLAKCVEPVCDDPETRIPDSVSCQSVRVRKARAGGGLPYEPARYERVYVAEGRGVSRPHPTPEGAIQAWREAVRGGATMGKP